MTTQNKKKTSWFCWDTDFWIQCLEFNAKRRAGSDMPMSVRLAILGCFIVGCIGIIKALEVSSPSGILACLLASVVAFGAVIFFRTRRQ